MNNIRCNHDYLILLLLKFSCFLFLYCCYKTFMFVLLQIMYRPLKGLNGIPGAESLVACLTGYHGQDRDDVMVCISCFILSFTCHSFYVLAFMIAKNDPGIVASWVKERFPVCLFSCNGFCFTKVCCMTIWICFLLRQWLAWWVHSFLSHW